MKEVQRGEAHAYKMNKGRLLQKDFIRF